MDNKEKRIKEFIEELKKISLKYGVLPWSVSGLTVVDKEFLEDLIKWREKNN